MLAVAQRFDVSMSEVLNVIDLTKATFDLAKQNSKRFRSQHPMARAALTVQITAKRLALTSALPYEGAFLTASAEYEMAVRDLFERFASAVCGQVPQYVGLPDVLRRAHVRGAATILTQLHREKFQHLTPEAVVGALAGCLSQAAGAPYSLLGEAFSENDRNFKVQVISEHMKRIGLKDFWPKISLDPVLQAAVGAATAGMTERVAKTKLDGIMDRRNQLIHRGRGFAAASESEARAAVEFFRAFVPSAARVLHSHAASL